MIDRIPSVDILNLKLKTKKDGIYTLTHDMICVSCKPNSLLLFIGTKQTDQELKNGLTKWHHVWCSRRNLGNLLLHSLANVR